ncbi:MAG: hypothetical protein FJ147_04580 [Deltaproteobacteria bacterium]|nr:hypothetical protein [Deltaproteobacteria bacterium]
MTGRHYGFRFNGVEGGLLLGSILLASFLIFVSGVYVGREVGGRKVVAPSHVVRVPISPVPDPIVTRTTPTSESNAAVRTDATSQTSMTWPVTSEKSVSPTPPLPRAEVTQRPAQEKPRLSPSAVPTPATKEPRTVSSLVVKEDPRPARTKPPAEPFAPKIPVAVESRPEKATTTIAARTEKPSPTVTQRAENTAKRPTPVTVAHVERTEPPARPRSVVAEGKRAEDGKSSEVKKPQEIAKKVAKSPATSAWRVQVGATTYQETAQDMARELRELGYRPSVSKVQINGETLYRVRIGSFGKQGEAAATVGRFRREGRFSQAYLVTE